MCNSLSPKKCYPHSIRPTYKNNWRTLSLFYSQSCLTWYNQKNKWGLSDSCKGISPSNNSRKSCQATGQRFLDLPQLTLAGIWFPLITYWLTTYCRVGQRLSIAIDPTSMGLYKSLHGQLNLAATQPSHCTGRCCPNWETVTYLNLPSLSNKFYRYLKNIKSLL